MKSAIPTVLASPFVGMLANMDAALAAMHVSPTVTVISTLKNLRQPYLALAKGNASAENSLLLSYSGR